LWRLWLRQQDRGENRKIPPPYVRGDIGGGEISRPSKNTGYGWSLSPSLSITRAPR
jgi:hypothetical protein